MLTQGKSDSPTKRKAKTTGKRAGGRPTRKLQTSGKSLQAEIPAGTSKSNNNIPQPTTPDTDKTKMTINHRPHPKILPHRLSGRTRNRPLQRKQSQEGNQREIASRRFHMRLVIQYLLTRSKRRTMKRKNNRLNFKSIHHRTNKQTIMTIIQV